MNERDIEFAKPWEWLGTEGWTFNRASDLQKFADLIRADEREACAKFCETNQVWIGHGKRGFTKWGEEDFATGGRHQGMDYAGAIRARGNK